MTKDCTICEHDSLMRVAELEIENERLRDWKYLLEKSLENEQELNKFLREDNEELENKLRIYQEHCIKEKSEKQFENETSPKT